MTSVSIELLTFTSAQLYLLQMTGSLVISSAQTPLQTTWNRVEDAMLQRLLNYTHCFMGFAAETAAQNNRRCDLIPREHHAVSEIKFRLKLIISSDLAANPAVFMSALGFTVYWSCIRLAKSDPMSRHLQPLKNSCTHRLVLSSWRSWSELLPGVQFCQVQNPLLNTNSRKMRLNDNANSNWLVDWRHYSSYKQR